jgi:phosphoserine phosphatase
MDSTLIQTEVIDELADLAGVGEQVRAITESAMNGEIDFKEALNNGWLC